MDVTWTTLMMSVLPFWTRTVYRIQFQRRDRKPSD